MVTTAYELSGKLGTSDKPGFRFGIDSKETAKALRQLADAIEQKRIHVDSGRVMTLANREDFTRSVLRLVFVEKVDAASTLDERALDRKQVALGAISVNEARKREAERHGETVPA